MVPVLPPWFTEVSPNPGAILISRGGINVTGVNFVFRFNFAGVEATLAALATSGTNGVVTSSPAGQTSSQSTQTSGTTAPAVSPTPTDPLWLLVNDPGALSQSDLTALLGDDWDSP